MRNANEGGNNVEEEQVDISGENRGSDSEEDSSDEDEAGDSEDEHQETEEAEREAAMALMRHTFDPFLQCAMTGEWNVMFAWIMAGSSLEEIIAREYFSKLRAELKAGHVMSVSLELKCYWRELDYKNKLETPSDKHGP